VGILLPSQLLDDGGQLGAGLDVGRRDLGVREPAGVVQLGADVALRLGVGVGRGGGHDGERHDWRQLGGTELHSECLHGWQPPYETRISGSPGTSRLGILSKNPVGGQEATTLPSEHESPEHPLWPCNPYRISPVSRLMNFPVIETDDRET